VGTPSKTWINNYPKEAVKPYKMETLTMPKTPTIFGFNPSPG